MSNRLQYETSPYLLQHKDNPVDWYPWCEEAFLKAKSEDKPIFLSIGYSTCHWCHVLAHESFEDTEIAGLLNQYFISIKVDKEERPDIDSVYMSVCQAFTGSGGWPTSIFMTWEQKPFFAGTYFPRTTRGGRIGFRELLITIHEKWQQDREALLQQSERIVEHLNKSDLADGAASRQLVHSAAENYEHLYDSKYGGFGQAPKFPTPHNLLFLLGYYERYKKASCLNMAEHTLLQMYRGGLFDHIGFGFCRYSTDRIFLVPHFEKMLYDNGLLILAYCKGYVATKNSLYLEIAEKTANYLIEEMADPKGGFYSAQDADSDGEEGKYYLFTPDEILKVLGKEKGEAFNRHYGISKKGNFEGKNIPNRLAGSLEDKALEAFLPQLKSYRKKRHTLHLDDKILTAWNSLVIGALCELYLAGKKEQYLQAAMEADAFIQKYLLEKDSLFVSFCKGKRGVRGFLDDYAGYIFAQLALYRATLKQEYLNRAERLCRKVMTDFSGSGGGFYLYSRESEELILHPKETYDGAIPSGNSLMAYNLVRMSMLTDDEKYQKAAEEQLNFLGTDAERYPPGYGMFLTAFLEYLEPPMKVTIVPDEQENRENLPLTIPPYAVAVLLQHPTAEYPLKDGKTTYYVCRNHSCLPPVHALTDEVRQP
ncbi:thioredoxin domain-containing protein [Candidatus Merdisoma sp. JLR.KK006]|uniref:thioredoxin domain-containing protein n=1 Tax=Candidatus Merdisoma sp. JLR.KK006 TaxID=3112626 RepID=UPI002FEFAD70